jgi:putative copper export protein
MKKAPRGRLSTCYLSTRAGQAALSHMAVSNALLISGMFMPKLAFAAVFVTALLGLSAMLGATSVARSHDPSSWERATEKNRST